jgi:hypothetical protein
MRESKIGRYTIKWDEIYYLAYTGGHRELPAKDQKAYNGTLLLPLTLRRKEQANLGLDKNPNVIPLKGLYLLELIKDKKFVPFFDKFFEHTKLLQMNDEIVFEAIRQKSYEIAMRI